MAGAVAQKTIIPQDGKVGAGGTAHYCSHRANKKERAACAALCVSLSFAAYNERRLRNMPAIMANPNPVSAIP